MFDSYNEYVRFRDKVDLAILKLGFKSHTEFLRAVYLVLESMVSDDDVEARRKSVTYIIEAVKRKLARVRA